MKEKNANNKLRLVFVFFLIITAAFSAKNIIAQNAGAGEKTESAESAKKAETGEKKEKPPAYIGTETCLSCHDGYDKSFMTTKHRMLFTDIKAKGEKSGCEACHGPAEKHLDNPEQGVNRFEKMKSGAISNVCLKCHMSGDKMNWKMTGHAAGDVSCINCHSVHGPKYEKTDAKNKDKNNMDEEKHPYLLTMGETKLCLSCHKEKAAEISMPSHHPIREGKVTCSGCHSPHDNTTLTMQKATTGCVKCHTEKAGPFAFEHTPVTESCTSCHTPHGSTNQQLLTLRQPALCLQCHATTPITHNVGSATYKTCTSCHEEVHGSNNAADLLN